MHILIPLIRTAIEPIDTSLSSDTSSFYQDLPNTSNSMDEFSNPADSKPSKTPLGVTGSSTPHKAVIKNVDMADNMKDRAIELATEGLNKYSMEKDMAEFLKREFDAQYGVTWHCVVGKK